MDRSGPVRTGVVSVRFVASNHNSHPMYNPFEALHNRLSSIETLLAQALPLLQQSTPTFPENGGIDLVREITRLSKPRIYALVSKRGIPHSKRGTKLYFNRADLLSWIAVGKREESLSSFVR